MCLYVQAFCNGYPLTVETVEEEDDEASETVVDDDGAGTTDLKKKKGFPGNTDPGIAQKTFLRTAMEDAVNNGGSLPTIDVDDIVGRTFITTPDSDGEQVRATIERAEFTQHRTADGIQPLIKFHCEAGDAKFEEILTYNRMMQWVEEDASSDKDHFFKIVGISGHRLKKGKWYIRVRWQSGQTTWEPLSDRFEDDPVTISLYAKKHDLLDKDGWKRCRRYAKREKVLGRMANQVRLRNYRNRPRYKYGFQVPRSHEEAVLIDEKNGN